MVSECSLAGVGSREGETRDCGGFKSDIVSDRSNEKRARVIYQLLRVHEVFFQSVSRGLHLECCTDILVFNSALELIKVVRIFCE
mgnify:CR=1 FL=1